MPLRLALAALLLALAAPGVRAQDAPPPTNAPAFAPFDLPTPNPYRSASGQPGPAYWQQRADYAIEAEMTADGRITGAETITYTNNSPDALPFLWVALEQNLFRPDSRGARTTPADTRFSGAFPEGGVDLGAVTVTHGGATYAPAQMVDDTRLRLDLREPLAPGQTLTLRIEWAFTLPPYGADRSGRFDAAAGTVFEVAQWYPYVMVYDDVHGWNTLPYLGQGEFYRDFGAFDVALTVPADMVVVATGEQQNPDETWTPEQRRRLDRARASEEPVAIITPDEAGTRAGSGTTTWRYRADDVRDFAWAASRSFILDGAGYTTPAGNDVLILSAYPFEATSAADSVAADPGWEEATRYGRHSIKYNSEQWYPYPYPVAINVAGVVGGMEYPMIQFTSAESRGQRLYGTVDHELGHNWFPMIVGSDERRHAWMDEGFNSFINALSGPAFYDEGADTTLAHYGEGDQVRMYRLTRADFVAGRMQEALMQDQPIVTTADQLRRPAVGFLAYRKPARGLQLLRELILGPDRFDAAFRAYIERWAFKHPQPADFFRTMEDVAGEDLDWFWRSWFYSTHTADQAIAGVSATAAGIVVTLTQRDGLLLPVPVGVTYADGRTEEVRVPVEAFYNDDRFELALPAGVKAVTLDPARVVPDTDRSNNTWPAPAASE